MNNNKISKLKNLLLGTTVLTAALGFGAQAWGAREVKTADYVAAANNNIVVNATDNVTISQDGANANVTLFVGSVADGKRVVAKQITGNANALTILLSGGKSIYILGDDVGVNAPAYALVGLNATNVPATYNNGGGQVYEGLAVTDGAVANIFGGRYTFSGDLLSTKVSLVAKSIATADGITETTTAKNIAADLSGATNLGGVNGGLTLSLSGAGSHLYTFADADTVITGITAAKDTGAIVLAADAGAARTLTMSSFNVDSTSGVMVKNTNGGNTNALVVVTGSAGNTATVTMTADQNDAANGPKGLLSGNNTDAANASFKVEGTAVVTGGGTIPEISIELAPQAYAHIGSVGATAGRYDVYNNTGLTAGGQRYVKAKLVAADAILDMAGAVATPAPAHYAKQVNGKLTLNSANQVVRLSGKGEVGFNGTPADVQVAKFFNDNTATAKTHGEFIFTNGGAANSAKVIRFSGAGDQTLTFSASANTGAAQVNLDDTSGNVTLIWNDSTLTHVIPGLSATVVVDKTPTLSLGADDGKGNLTGKAMIFSEDVIPTGRKVVINAPIVMNAGGVIKNLTLANGADIKSNIILDNAAMHVLTFDGGADAVKQVYNVSARAY
jgi:hypothetical protein